MKKISLILLTFCALSASAQKKIVIGDMNNDGVLSVEDITLLTSTILGERDIITHRCSADDEEENGNGDSHEYVDLGLPSGTLWATCNIGAETPEDYGYYFAWGEVEPKSNYSWSTYFDSVDGSSTNFKTYYNKGGKTELDLKDDAAYVNWGEGWRIPSNEQLAELRTKCIWVWNSTKKGYTIIGPNDKIIFLPVAGYRNSSSSSGIGVAGYYWSRSLRSDNSSQAYVVNFNSSDIRSSYNDTRNTGRSVRPVSMSTTE